MSTPTDRDGLAPDLLRVVAGSRLYGTSTTGSDHDEFAVFAETAAQVLGLAPRTDHRSMRTAGTGNRSGIDDVDVTAYSLHKVLALAMAGNPNALIPLFAAGPAVLEATEVGTGLLGLTPHVVSVHAARRLLGYGLDQRDRLLGGGRRSNVPKRPELVAAHGHDVKYAGHALRLPLQGLELVATGALALPMPAATRDAVLAVRTGQVNLAGALALIDDASARLDRALGMWRPGHGALPESPDWDLVNAWLVDAYPRVWEQAEALPAPAPRTQLPV